MVRVRGMLGVRARGPGGRGLAFGGGGRVGALQDRFGREKRDATPAAGPLFEPRMKGLIAKQGSHFAPRGL